MGEDLHLGGLLQGKEGRAVLAAGRLHPALLHLPAPRVREERRGVQEARDRRDLLPVRERLLRHEQVGQGQDLKAVKVIPDGSLAFTNAMDMNVQKDNHAFGQRSWRYAVARTT